MKQSKYVFQLEGFWLGLLSIIKAVALLITEILVKTMRTTRVLDNETGYIW